MRLVDDEPLRLAEQCSFLVCEEAQATELGRRAGIEDGQRALAAFPEDERAGDVTVAVEHQVGAAEHALDEVGSESQLLGERPAEPGREPFEQPLLGQRQDVVVERDHPQGVGGGEREQAVDLVEHALADRAVAGDQEAVVRGRRVDADEEQARTLRQLDPRAGLHDRRADVVAQAVVVAGHERDPAAPEQRREDTAEQRQLRVPTPVGDVAGDEDVVDLRVEQRVAQAERGVERLVGAAEVQVRDVGEGAGSHARKAARPKGQDRGGRETAR